MGVGHPLRLGATLILLPESSGCGIHASTDSRCGSQQFQCPCLAVRGRSGAPLPANVGFVGRGRSAISPGRWRCRRAGIPRCAGAPTKGTHIVCKIQCHHLSTVPHKLSGFGCGGEGPRGCPPAGCCRLPVHTISKRERHEPVTSTAIEWTCEQRNVPSGAKQDPRLSTTLSWLQLRCETVLARMAHFISGTFD